MHADMEKITAIYALAANFGKEMPENLLEMWLDLLESYSSAQVHAGVRAVIAGYAYKTLPPFAVLREAIDKACGNIPAETARDVAAESEWSKLVADISRCGRYAPPMFCPTTAHVLRAMGGWDAACNWRTEELHWRRGEFVESWKMAHGREDIMELGAEGVLQAVQTCRGEAVASLQELVGKAISTMEQR